MLEQINELINGAYDLHVHSSPDIVPRKFNDIELVLAEKKAGMAGVLIKNHFVDTSSRAILVRELVGNINIFGGIALNNSVGGLNPSAVEVALKLGAKEVWMPTVDSYNHKIKMGSKEGLSILNNDEKLKNEVYEILENIAFYNVILGTGHLSIKEIFVLVKEAINLGVRKILITHPEYWITHMSIDTQIELSKYGVFFERCYYSSTLETDKQVEYSQIINCINKVGFDNSIISTDLGQKNNISPIEGFKIIISNLLKANFSKNQIKKMIIENPKYLLYS